MAEGGAVPLVDIAGIKCFDTEGDQNSLGLRWTRWLRSFELYAEGKGVKDAGQKRALLLHAAGVNVQDIYYTFAEKAPGEHETVYSVAKKQLDEHFKTKVNVPYERSLFRSMGQNSDETVEQYIVRLRQRGSLCEFADLNEMIRDQIIEKCNSKVLRRKLLEKQDLTLDKLRQIAQAFEMSQKQADCMEQSGKQDVNRVRARAQSYPDRKRDGKTKWADQPKCFSCGYVGHMHKDPKCPAKGQKCRKCSNIGHFEVCCKTKDKKKFSKFKKGKIRNVEAEEADSSDSEYVFTVRNGHNREAAEVDVKLGGIEMKMLVDSGATVNVVGRPLWEELKEKKIKCKSRRVDKKLFGYGSDNPLTVAGCFEADIVAHSNTTKAEFFVIEEDGEALLGRETAMKLGVLKIGITETINNVNDTMSSESIKEKYPECFKGVGKLRNYQLKIPLDESVNPVVQQLRRTPYHLKGKVDTKLDELLELDIIEKVDGPSDWVSQVVVIPKASGDIRLCLDMRSANEAVKRVRYPIPTVDEVIQDFNQSKVFSKLDIKWAYHQIELHPDSREITTFITHRGLFRYKRLMFGISCAPEMYNKLIHQALEGIEGVHSIFDDIVVHAGSTQEHDAILEKVLQRLSERGLTLNADKCQIGLDRIEFMGHVLSEHGISLAESKTEAVLNARRPESVAEVRSFLGLVNFSSRFIPDLATIAEPLRRLTKKSEPFEWGQQQEESFNRLKQELSNSCTLKYYDTSANTQVIADASPVGLGAVLVQEQDDQYRVISYASRSLTDVEKRYSQTEKEALALVWACERFQMYLHGTEFELVTDHKPLEFIFSKRSKMCARVERWVLRLQSFRYRVKYIPGPNNIADALSRLLSEENTVQSKSNITEEYVYFVAKEATPVAMNTVDIEQASSKDPEMKELREGLITGKWYNVQFKEYLPVRHELSSVGKLILRGTRLVIPTSLRNQVLALGHEGHPGIVVMKQRLRPKVWWPGIDKDIEQYCKSCYGCQLVSNASPPEPVTRTELPAEPWQSLAVDFMGPLPSGDSVFVVVDYYSRWVEAIPTKTTTAEKVVEILKQIFARFGLPTSITTDNGPQFVSETFHQYLTEMGIAHRQITPLYPAANGEVERQNRSILKRLRIAQAEGRSWKEELQTYLIMYRSTAHSVTGVSPAEKLLGRRMRTKLPDLCEYRESDYEIRDRDSERKQRGKEYTDRKRGAVESELKAGDRVLVKQNRENKLTTNFNPKPMVVVEKNKNSVVVKSNEGVNYRRNVTHLKKFNERESEMVNPNQNSESVSVSAENDSGVFGESRRYSDRSESTMYETNPSENSSSETSVQSENIPEQQTVVVSSTPRPSRTRRMPKKFEDFEMT